MTKTIKKLKIKLHYDVSYFHTKPTKMKYKQGPQLNLRASFQDLGKNLPYLSVECSQ